MASLDRIASFTRQGLLRVVVDRTHDPEFLYFEKVFEEGLSDEQRGVIRKIVRRQDVSPEQGHLLCKAGLIERRSCPTDRRGVFAHMTPKGEAAFKKAHAAFMASLERNFGSALKPGEADAVSAALARLS